MLIPKGIYLIKKVDLYNHIPIILTMDSNYAVRIKEDREMDKSAMINEILQACKANGVYTSGDLFFSLAFRSESELKRICQELHIKL